MDPSRRSGTRGMTLVELLFVVAILGVIVAGITKTMIDLDRTSRVRNLNVTMQGEGRDALQIMVRDVRQASLGSALGVIWTQDALGNVVQRPAVQLFDNVSAASANLDVKAGTDALLVVGARTLGGVAAAQGTAYDSTQTLAVTDASGFAVGDAILAGPYGLAAWSRVTAIVAATGGDPGGLNLATSQNVYPKGKLDAGSLVRAARARLYYVDAADELVQLELLVPRAPGSTAELGARSVIAQGVENLQLDCETDSGVAAGPCPAVVGGDPVTTEAAWAFGDWSGGGARITTGSISTLRGVILTVVMRSQSDLRGQTGDPPIAVGNQAALQAAVADPTQPYLRRAYRLPVAVRNTSLGAF